MKVIILLIILIITLVILLYLIKKKIIEKFENEYNLIIITSVIHTINKPLSYSATRSVFSPEERIKQTIDTINSIKRYIPNSYIVLIEGSELSVVEKDILKENVDEIFQCKNIENISSKFKGLGETSMISEFINSEIFKKIRINYNLKSITKITGRYKLNENYSYSKYPLDKIVLKQEGDDWHVTSSYRVGSNQIDNYIKELDRVLNLYKDYERSSNSNNELSLEKTMFWGLSSDNIYAIRHPDKYGVIGLSSADGTIIESFIIN